ncbi:MAG: hypothetical protein QF647_07115 [SAR324 cluster bacterium]|nr:hypothetical protein [SAR324 cluster bacterium]
MENMLDKLVAENRFLCISFSFFWQIIQQLRRQTSEEVSHNRAWYSSNENNPGKKKEIKNLFRNHNWSLVNVLIAGFLSVNNSLVCKFNNTPLS